MADTAERVRNLRFAADESRDNAHTAITSAMGEQGYQRSQYLTVAAQALRDAKTFDGEANGLELFGSGD